MKLWGVNHLYVIGGNGGNAAANAIHVECQRQAVQCAVVGVPKSIDNDILLARPEPCALIRAPWPRRSRGSRVLGF